MARAIAKSGFDQCARQRDHEGAKDQDGERDAHRRIGQDQPDVAVEQADSRVDRIERVRHDDMRDHLGNEQPKDKTVVQRMRNTTRA
jgi:hypothetical protein